MKAKSKIYKYLIFTIVVSSIFGIINYNLLSNRHQAILKTKVLHLFHLVDNNWNIKSQVSEYKMVSPTLLIDNIYKSMEGPKVSRYIQLNETNKVTWITGFNVKAIDAKTEVPISNDFICHMNVDINDVTYHTNFNLTNRINKQYPRLTSLSNGFENIDFPDGYGVPIIGNDPLFITTESLNHNITPVNKKIKHVVTIKNNTNTSMKPLLSKTIFIQLPYDKYDPFKSPLDPGSNQCIPMETKNSVNPDAEGNMYSGHWVIPKGKNTYKSNVNYLLQLKDSLRLHYAAIHVHPFATKITLFDITENKAIFISNISNYTDKIGLIKIDPFSSKEGKWLYENHDYELILEVNNTSKIEQDMMGSMFLFFYDKELEKKLKQ